MMNQKKKKKVKKREEILFPLRKSDIEDIIINKNKSPLIYYNYNKFIKTKYKYQNRTKNYIFYRCYLRNKCPGTCKIDIKEKNVIITNLCSTKVEHNLIEYDTFANLMNHKKTKELNFNEKKMQKYFVYYCINNNSNIDNPTIKKKFKELTGFELKLTLTNLSNIRNKVNNNYKNIPLEELIPKIGLKVDNFKYYIVDFLYEYKKANNNIIKRNQRIFIFGAEDNILLLDHKKTKEFFLDITFKIIPKVFRPYKLLIISGISNNNENPQLMCFILLKYMDELSYNKIFNYLYENFNFKPMIIHTDFEKSLISSIKKNQYFGKTVINSKCLFHLGQMILKQLIKIGYHKKKFNKKAIEILRNIEILCFIKKEKIKDYKDIIIKKLSGNDNYKSFLNYLKNYFFKLNETVYNYEKIIYNQQGDIIEDNKFLNKLYLTNNVSESINSKLNYYLPKRATNNKDFVESISKICINNNIKKNNIIRHDYITRSMLLMIKDLNLNENPKWISYEEFYNFLQIIIKKNYNDINDEKCEDTLIKIINELESSEFANNIEFFKNTNDNINNNSNSQVDIKNNINIKENIKDQIIEINDEEQNNNNNNKSDLSESSEMSENNSADNIINEDDNTIENLMENLNIEETDENLQDISNKENIYHLPLLKRIEKKII